MNGDTERFEDVLLIGMRADLTSLWFITTRVYRWFILSGDTDLFFTKQDSSLGPAVSLWPESDVDMLCFMQIYAYTCKPSQEHSLQGSKRRNPLISLSWVLTIYLTINHFSQNR